MPEFLQLLSPQDALTRWMAHLPDYVSGIETLETNQATGRITAEEIISPENLPGFNRSTMDGYAVIAHDTFGASDTLPAYLTLVGEVPMGGQPNFALSSGNVGLIYTGGMLPAGADAVVMLENTQNTTAGEIEVYKPVGAGENILVTGEDFTLGQVVLPAGVRIRPAEIGGLMAIGITRVKVATRPIIGIISSGDEIISPWEQPSSGQVRDINSFSLAALVENLGGNPIRYGIVTDQASLLQKTLLTALDQCSAVIITAGSSASQRDLTAQVIQEMGTPGVLVHGVNVRPGKPTILAVCNGRAVIGLPGNPVSALVIAHLFVTPLIEHLLGVKTVRPKPQVTAHLTINLASQAGREDYYPVTLKSGSQGYLAEPIFYKSNLIFSMVRADGLVKISSEVTGLSAGDQVSVALL